ncbi:MAG: flagellar basal-body rod protein FlgG, partial [Fibrobacteres bacterium]|nr:flagellar basal-body rod protein FlgG [Fibrobacterota bacterium]
VGLGVEASGNQKLFTQGNLIQTDQRFDFALEGDGFFQIMKPDGNIAYTRNGALKINDEGQIVNSDGYALEPALILPEEGIVDSFTVDPDGKVFVQMYGEEELTEIGQVEIARFINPAGLSSIGSNLFLQTGASGSPIVSPPGEDGNGQIAQGKLETSNVMIVEEMVNMIMAQRAYEVSSKAVSTSDEMLQLANQLKR